ncbi:hypothetical protein ASF61_21225 [Duganella sp. Leaf126]|uniref:TolC family protein n=1 Tax=Duganella sp. Leaf126 TaxID=1736266 RepID=UPI0006F787E3|nr:TolC family protein [Duganella sp. Leaf126]KQQ44654.1 hypothetical protein ASF61_21225 [Duganella sp. Leaf126]
MHKRVRLITSGVLLCTTLLSPLHAETMTFSLGDAISRAQQRAPAIVAAEAALRAADANIEVARLRPNPTLSYEAENVMGTGRYADFGSSERTITVSVPIELGGKREARRRVAEAERGATNLGVATTRADITQRVTIAFIVAAAAEQRLDVTRSGHELARQAAHAAHERVAAGKASPIEEERARVMLINAEVKLGKTERALKLALADLGRYTGDLSPGAIRAPWFGALVEAKQPVHVLLPATAAAEARLGAASARVDAARRDRIPDLTLVAGSRRFGDNPDRAAVLGISIPFPLFNQGTQALARTQAEYERTQAERDAAIQDADQALAHAQVDVADALAAAEAARGPALAAAEEAARIARLGYTEGKFPQLELIEAERALAETREAAVDALAAFHTAQAQLAYLHGTIAPLYKD